MNRKEAVKCYAGALTAFVVLVAYTLLMYKFTNEDALEILVSYMAFLFAPSFLVPYFIAGEDDEKSE